ncbi:hypothetical protein [Chakrabartyella piscis]|uniref:hypothetical protein n=1 Tax=Chakrabartyella piscis TaxID=2918914 RepID=UPI0029586587|nr:hypothetical protein [Chakrabartyella piscis]
MWFKKEKSTRDMVGIANINETSIETLEDETLVFFILQPDNLAVLSEEAVHTKIRNLTAILKSLDGLEMACINSRENFDSNKHFYKQRILRQHRTTLYYNLCGLFPRQNHQKYSTIFPISPVFFDNYDEKIYSQILQPELCGIALEEKILKVREILEQELTYLDRVQVQMASARGFLLVARAKNSQEEVLAVIGRVEKLLKDNGFNGRLARKEDLKRILSVYFIQNITQVYFDDIDGERYVKENVL